MKKTLVLILSLILSLGAIFSLTACGETVENHKITFDANGGTVSVAEKIVTFNQKIGELPTPTRDGYRFIQWVYEREGQDDVEITSSTVYKYRSDITLTAVWRREVTITFDAGDGVLEGESQKIVLEGDRIGPLPTAIKQDWFFQKWVRETDDGDVIITENTVMTADTPNFTAKAVYNEEEIYPIILNLGGGQIADEYKTEYRPTDEDYALPTPTREHNIFLGWTCDGVTQPQNPLIIPRGSKGAKEFIANWERVSYQVTVRLSDVVGGQTVTGSIQGETTFVVGYGRTVSSYLGDAVAPDGYDFIRWVFVDGESEKDITEYTTFRESVFGDSNEIVIGAKYGQCLTNFVYRVQLELKHEIGNFAVTGRYDTDKSVPGEQHFFYVTESGKTVGDYLDGVNDDTCDHSNYGFYRWVLVKTDGTRVPLADDTVFSPDIFGTETNITIAAEYEYTYTDWV